MQNGRPFLLFFSPKHKVLISLLLLKKYDENTSSNQCTELKTVTMISQSELQKKRVKTCEAKKLQSSLRK